MVAGTPPSGAPGGSLADDGEAEEVLEEHELRILPRDRFLVYLAEGWEVLELERPHGAYSVLAVRPAR